MKKAITHLKNADPVLGALIARAGPCRIEYEAPTFESLARSIVYQQLNGRAAATIYARLEAACGEGGVRPEAIRGLRPAKLRSAGISPQKSGYLKDLARLTLGGKLDFAALATLSDEDVLTCLTQVKGVGAWTAHMFLIFALRRPDVLPTGDYGIRVAMKKLYRLPDLPKAPEMERIAASWRPWRSVATWYLWRGVDGQVPL